MGIEPMFVNTAMREGRLQNVLKRIDWKERVVCNAA